MVCISNHRFSVKCFFQSIFVFLHIMIYYPLSTLNPAAPAIPLLPNIPPLAPTKPLKALTLANFYASNGVRRPISSHFRL